MTAESRGSKLWDLLTSIRHDGWSVAVHNDYRINGCFATFWLFTKGDRAAKGEGATDEIALAEVRRVIDGMVKP